MSQHPTVSSKGIAASNRHDRLETLLKNLPGMAYRCLNLPHWPMDFVSEGCFALCGYHRHEIESQQVLWGDFTHPDMIDEVDQKVRSAADHGEPFEVEYRIITREGAEKWVWERGRVVDFRGDGVAVLEGFITDITDRKLAETALMRAEAYAQAIVQSAVEGVITLDQAGIIESFNEAAGQMFGYSHGQVYRKHCRLLFSPHFFQRFDEYFQRCRRRHSKAPIEGELDGRHRDGGDFPTHLSINEIWDAEERKYVVLIRDLTNQRAAEKEVREQRELLAHVDRLNTLGEMAAGIAHEINQPLTAISMYAKSCVRLLQKSPQLSTQQVDEVLEKLSAQAHRAGAVIERMQQLTRRRESEREEVDCAILIDEVSRLAEVESRLLDFAIVTHIEEELPAVKCDPIQIQQVMLNLLRNGMEAMRCEPNTQHKQIRLEAHKFGRHGIEIAIVDSGGGISDELAGQLYQPFTSTKKSGMGLGLSISRSIIAAHGGELKFANNDEGGTTFSFVLPLAGQ